MEYLQVYHFENKQRIGRMEDGGYVTAVLEGDYDLYIGCGLNDEISFEQDFANKFPHINGFTFDGSLSKRPDNLPRQFAFVPINVGGENTNNETNLVPFLNVSNNVFLKMDIEGSEWVWLSLLEDKNLIRIKQIVIELHWLTDDRSVAQVFKINCLRRLAQYFYLVHVHPNNYANVINGVPQVIECTYIRKSEFKYSLPYNTLPFPTKYDFPNCSSSPEIILNYPPFITNFVGLKM